MTSEISKISGDCRKIKLQNFSILQYYSSICATTRVCAVQNCSKLLLHTFYKNLCLSSLSSQSTYWEEVFKRWQLPSQTSMLNLHNLEEEACCFDPVSIHSVHYNQDVMVVISYSIQSKISNICTALSIIADDKSYPEYVDVAAPLAAAAAAAGLKCLHLQDINHKVPTESHWVTLGDHTQLTTVVGEFMFQLEKRLTVTALFHGQERNLATEPSLWPVQLYGTVYQQQFVMLTACIRSDASSKRTCLLYVLMTD